jgi:hypothetical protein
MRCAPVGVPVLGIQRDLVRFFACCNLERGHQGYRLRGRTPAHALCAALGIEELPAVVLPAEEVAKPAAWRLAEGWVSDGSLTCTNEARVAGIPALRSRGSFRHDKPSGLQSFRARPSRAR